MFAFSSRLFFPKLNFLEIFPDFTVFHWGEGKSVRNRSRTFLGIFDHTLSFPPVSVCPATSQHLSLLSLHLSCVPPAAVDHWGPRSQQAAARWSIMSLIGGMSEMATISKGRKQWLEGLTEGGGCGGGDGENEGRKGKLRDRGERFVLIRGGRARSPC